MKIVVTIVAATLALPAIALDGDIRVHDPSTVISQAGHYYVYGTGNGIPVLTSDDGWTWRRAGALMDAVAGGKPGPVVLARGGNNTWAPDVVHIGARYFIYYSAPGTQPRSAIGLLTGTTLDPAAPDYRWEDRGPVVWSDGVEDSNAIDPGVLLDPDGRLWLTYGSYFGYIRLVELDPNTGLRRYPDRKPTDIAINSEASILIHHGGWYYLLVTHGSCCQGANSTYNIRMGRSRKVTGPYLDNMGVDMIEGGGKLFAASRGRHVGPGHFGRLDLGDGVEKFSLHYEADLDRGGISVLDIRPLLWRDGWPVAGDNLTTGTYGIESVRTGTVLELAVQGSPVGGFRARRPGGAGSGPPSEPPPGPPIAEQDSAQVAASWLASSGVRLAPALAGTERSLTATAGGELAAAAFSGAPEQLWRIDQLTDGSYRILAKAVPGTADTLALAAVGSSTATLEKFDPASDRQRWKLAAP